MYSLSIGSVLFICLVLQSANNMDQSQDICSFLKTNGTYEGIGLYKRYSENRTSDDVPHLMYNKRGQELNFELNEDHTMITMTEIGITSIDKRILNMFGIYFRLKHFTDEFWANCYVSAENISWIQCQDLSNIQGYINISNPHSIIFRAHSTYANKSDNSYYTIIRSKHSKENVCIKSNWFGVPGKKFLEYYTVPCTTAAPPPETKFIDFMDESLLQLLDAVLDINSRNRTVAGYLLVFNIDGSPMFCYQSAGEELADNCKYSENLIPMFDHCFNDRSKELSNNSIDPLFWILLAEVILAAILVFLILRMIEIRRNRWEQQNSDETLTQTSDTI